MTTDLTPPTLHLVRTHNRSSGISATRKLRRFTTYETPTFVATLPDVEPVLGAARTVIVCDPATPSMRDYPAMVAAGWDVYDDGGRWPTLRRDGTTVRWLGAWVGDHRLDPGQARTLWAMIEGRCRRLAPHAVPIGAPSTLGRDLWLRMIPEGERWPVLEPAVQQSLRDAGAQGRIETMPAPHGDPVELWEYDARLAYLSVLRDLPVGEPTVMDGADCASWCDRFPYAPGRFAVTWEAPPSWPWRFGVLPSWGTYPLAGSGVVDSCELDIARRHGWRISFDGGYVWQRTGDPFRRWADALVKSSHTPPAGADPAVWRQVWRLVALQTIGAMHGRRRRVTVFGPMSAAPDDDTVRPVGGGGARWVIEQAAAWPETHHPEWTTTIWARARRRLLSAPGCTGALHARGDVVGFRTDAIYTTRRQDWPDTGRLGGYRLKRHDPTPGPWPTDQAAMLARLTVTS